MKHYFSFLVLSLFVFLSLVCPSPVMADCTNSMSLDVKEDRVIPSACPCGAPGNLEENANYYDYAGFFWDWKGSSNGELYYKVTLPASTYSISISIANAKNAWMNIYSTTYSSNGTCTVEGVNYYKQSWHDMDQTHGEYQGSFKTETASSISLSAGTYIIGIYGENYTAFSGLTITAASDVFCESSCTAPNHVDVTGNYRFTPGETISLTAAAYSSEGTGSPITSGITYQWQKYNGSTWDDLTNGGNISGATSDNLQISSCTTSNGGSYRCKASTGSGCDKYSDDGKDAHFIRIWTFNGNYNDEGFIANNITWTGTNTGTVTLTLNANSTYKFKVFDNDGKWFGCNSGITADASNWTFRTNEGNCSLTTGKVTGEYTFTIDISNAGDNNISVSVTYPMMTIYMDCGSNGWCNDDPVFFAHTWKGGTSHNVKMTAHACESGLYYADIPSYDTDLKFTRQKPGSESIAWNGANFWNQSENITIGSNNKFTNTGWNTSPEPDEGTFSGSTYSPSTYTITFAGNGNSGGSMSNVTAIPCGEDRTLVANGFTKTGHSFTNWIANVDVKINGATVTAGSSISNEATIQDITQNITLTAQWAPKTTSVTLDANIAYHGATGSSVTATWGTALPGFDAATGVSGYALTGYFTAPTGGTKIINADGTLAASTTYTTADSKWNSELSALTLYPQYESSISPKTVPCSLGFYYTEVGTGTQDKVILDSDFSYSCNKDNAKNDQHNPNQEVCFSGSGHILTSRMNVVFPQTGTYIFTFPLYIKESGNYDAPSVTVNGQQSAAATISTTGEENRNYETTLNVTAGTYIVSVWIGNTNEKVFFSTMEIESYQCRNIITTGAVGLFDSNQGSGGGASYTCSSVADPECHFDHNVFCFEYSNMGGNSDNYYGCRLTSGPAYTPNAAATGFAFWYRTESGSDPVYMEFAGKVYKLAATNRAWRYAYVASSKASTKSGEFDIWINGQKDGFSTTQSSGKIYLSELQATNVTSADPIAPATTHTITVASNNNTYGRVSSTPASGSSVTDCASITVTATPESGCSFVEWKKGGIQVSTEPSYTFTMGDLNDGSDLTLTAYFQQDELTISSLPWAGDQDLTGQTVVSAEAISSCFDSEITFTFMGDGTVKYYANNNHETPLGTLTSGTAITLTDALRANGIYIQCTSGSATLTGVSKTTVGSVYTIWSGSVNVSANYKGIDENGEEVTLSAKDQNWWLQQVVLGPEHFQTAAVGDTLRVTYTNIENEYAMGAIQTATKYNAIPGNIYKESDGSTVSSNTGEFTLPSSGYYHIITAGSLDSLQHKGIVVKGKGHTITRVSLHASCSNLSLRTTAPDVTTYGDDESINIMTDKLEFGDGGFNLGNWEHQVELDESCFTNVTVGSIINLYMSVDANATLSFRCNVPSIIADDKQDGKGCPSYGDISFDRTIDDLYGHTPTVVGETEGYKVMYLKVDADMMRRLQETGMILCGKGTLIKVVEGVPETVEVNPGEERHVPTVVNNLIIHQGGEVTNTEDIEVLGKITYIRPAKDDGTGYKLGNKLDQWYTFALPFTVSDVEVYDETDKAWFDINAVYYSDDEKNQATNDPDGAGHYYLQYLKAENETAIGRDFAARWQYITPGHSEHLYAEDWSEYRYGYPKKDEAYIILFDSDQPSGLSGYWDSNPTIRFVGVGPQTIDGVAKKWKVEANGEQYWMYANNTLHSFTLPDAYILNEDGTKFVLQESPTIRPFECYVQATASLKEKCAAISMRGFRIDNTTTGAESIQGSAIRAEKILRNGQLIIIRNGVEYDATGVVIR